MDTDELTLCSECIREKYLSAEVDKLGIKQDCSYCGRAGKCWPLAEVAERIEGVVLAHYRRTPAEMDSYEAAMHNDPEGDYSWERSGEAIVDVIGDLAQVSEFIAQDIQGALAEKYASDPFDFSDQEDEFSSESHYKETDVDAGPWHNLWNEFTFELREKNRFFNHPAEERLDSIFAGIGDMQTWQGKPVCVDAGPGTAIDRLYRARLFRSDDGLAEALVRPDLFVGPPPHSLAASGRMNARGISVFYGSDDPEAALAEVRPPVGSHVVVALFLITRPLKLLDLRVLEKVFLKVSLFDPQAVADLGRARFLRTLRERMTMPAMKEDDLAEYLPTQAVADYLSNSMVHALDGIIFPSVQVSTDAMNVVLFNKASRVEPMVYPDDARVTADLWEHDEDGPVRSLRVYVTTGPKSKWPLYNEYVYEPVPEPSDLRTSTLKVEVQKLEVRTVKGLRFDTATNSIWRSEW